MAISHPTRRRSRATAVLAPTEAEWEYAARAGTTDRYLGEKLEEIAWFVHSSDVNRSAGEERSVGLKRPNRWGVYDMLGNVWEWCNDWYAKDYYTHSPRIDPQGPSTGTEKICRGGSWNSSAKSLRASRRGRHTATAPEATFGLRLVQQPR